MFFEHLLITLKKYGYKISFFHHNTTKAYSTKNETDFMHIF